MEFPALSYLSYGFLAAAVVCLWLPNRRQANAPLWGLAAGVACVLGVAAGRVDPAGVAVVAALGYALYQMDNRQRGLLGRAGAAGLALLLSLGLGMHVFPYFHNVQVLSGVTVGQGGAPFSLQFNFDKALAGVLLLGFSARLIKTGQQWAAMLKQTLPQAALLAGGVMAVAWWLGSVSFDPKWPASLPLWAANNLLFVCTAEEAFFRGLIQRKLTAACRPLAWGGPLALVGASLLFGLAHYAGGPAVSVLAVLAGLGYGWAYQQTGSIEASILAHFGLNLIHFIFFTYPIALGG